MVWIIARLADDYQLDFFTVVGDVPEYRNLAHCIIGINVGSCHYFIGSTVWKLAFPVPDFSIVYDFRYFTVLLAWRIKLFQVFVAGQTGALSKSLHHVGVHKSYPVIVAGNNDAVGHPVYDFEQLVSFGGYHCLQLPGFFCLITYDANEAANNTGEYGKNYHPEQRVRKRRYEKGAGQEDN